jgi:acyl carrier protein
MKEKFLELFKEVFEMEDQEVKFTDNFRDFDEWDSLTHLSLIAMLDDEFGIQIEEEELDKLNTVQDIFEKVNQA